MASPKPISLTQVPVDDYDGTEAPQPFVVVGPVPGGGGGGGSTAWGDITGKPLVIASGATQAAARSSISAPSVADLNLKADKTLVDQNQADVEQGLIDFANNTTSLLAGKADLVSGKVPPAQLPDAPTKASLGLGNVDNTSDANKPVSTPQQTALNLKAPLASPAFTGTPTGITKAHVGLGNADNTSDANKPVSIAQQVALDAKPGSAAYDEIIPVTAAEYAALPVKDPRTLYFQVG